VCPESLLHGQSTPATWLATLAASLTLPPEFSAVQKPAMIGRPVIGRRRIQQSNDTRR
jgi:hypothetical protein